MSNRSVFLSILLLLSACYGLERVDELRAAPATATPFHQELARLYLQFVDNELEKYDWDAAGYFAQKGVAATRGEQILPEDPSQWTIPDYAAQELASARASIMAKLSDEFVRTRPKVAASLLFHYDCWVEEQEEAWEQAAIDACKQQVLRQMSETDAPMEAMGGPLSTSYLFRFPQGAVSLEGYAMQELALIAQTVSAERSQTALVINGHADRPDGSGVDAKALSAKRARYIQRFLTQRGVPERLIRYFPTSDAAGSADVASNAANRVELFIE